MSKYATVDPSTGQMVQSFESISDKEARSALDEATRAHQGWSSAPASERAAVLLKIAQLHRTHVQKRRHRRTPA